MIPFNFIYCRPSTLKEAINIYIRLQKEEKGLYTMPAVARSSPCVEPDRFSRGQ